MSDDNTQAILAALEQLAAGQATLRADLMGRMDRLQDTLGADQARLRTDLMGRMDRLQDSVTAIRDDIGVNMGAVDAMRRLNETTREDLRSLHEQVSVMWRQLKAVQATVREITGGP